MLVSRMLLVVGTATLLSGCGSQDVSAPRPGAPTKSIVSASPNTIFGVAGSEMRSPFTVKVLSYPATKPVAGVVVTFVVVAHPTPAYSAVTNADGIATLDSIRLDATPGRYSVSATADGVTDDAPFTILVLSQAPTAVYDLKSIGGEAVTGTYPGPSFSPSVTAGHYLLFGDGTYFTIYDVSFVSDVSDTYRFAVQNPQTLDFYNVPASIPGFTPDPNYLFSVGTLSGNTMTVKYENNMDYEDEVYILRK
jgi:hypothetical protein